MTVIRMVFQQVLFFHKFLLKHNSFTMLFLIFAVVFIVMPIGVSDS